MPPVPGIDPPPRAGPARRGRGRRPEGAGRAGRHARPDKSGCSAQPMSLSSAAARRRRPNPGGSSANRGRDPIRHGRLRRRKPWRSIRSAASLAGGDQRVDRLVLRRQQVEEMPLAAARRRKTPPAPAPAPRSPTPEPPRRRAAPPTGAWRRRASAPATTCPAARSVGRDPSGLRHRRHSAGSRGIGCRRSAI